MKAIQSSYTRRKRTKIQNSTSKDKESHLGELSSGVTDMGLDGAIHELRQKCTQLSLPNTAFLPSFCDLFLKTRGIQCQLLSHRSPNKVDHLSDLAPDSFTRTDGRTVTESADWLQAVLAGAYLEELKSNFLLPELGDAERLVSCKWPPNSVKCL
jgi:hypothetical protein